MEFNEFLKKVSEGYSLIPIIKEIESYDNEAIDIYSNHFDKKKSFFFVRAFSISQHFVDLMTLPPDISKISFISDASY